MDTRIAIAVGFLVMAAGVVGIIAAVIQFIRRFGVRQLLGMIAVFGGVLALLTPLYLLSPEAWRSWIALAMWFVACVFGVVLFAPLGGRGIPLGFAAMMLAFVELEGTGFEKVLLEGEPAMDALLAWGKESVLPGVQAVVAVVLFPAMVPLLPFEYALRDAFGAGMNVLFFERWPWVGPFLMLYLVGGSWVFWSTLIPRALNYVGLWDPFHGGERRGRRKMLQRLVDWDYREAARKFGLGPTNRWAGVLELMSNRYEPGDLFLGRPGGLLGGMQRAVGIPTEKHMLTIAGTGAGKSTAALIPNLCLHEGSLLCIDPKGELAAITAARRGAGGNGVRGIGQKVFVLDPYGIVGPAKQSASYNPLDEMQRVVDAHGSGWAVSYADKIARGLVLTVAQKEPIWDLAARTMLWGLILYVFSQEPRDRRHLVRVYELLSRGDIEGREEKIAAGVIGEDDVTAWDVLVERMRHVPAGPYRDTIMAGAEELAKSDGRSPQGSALWTAREHTKFLNFPQVQDVCRRSDFLLEDLREKHMSVYLCLPLSEVKDTPGRWLRMFVVLFMEMMQRKAERLDPPVLMAVDEFAALGKLEGIEDIGPAMRSYGVRFWALAQNIGQLEETYGEKSAATLVSSAEAVQFMGIKHIENVRLLSALLGTHEVELVRHVGGRRVKDVVERPLLDPNQVMQILGPKMKNQIVWRGDRRPMMLKMTPYFEYLPYHYYSPDPRYREKWHRAFWRRLNSGGAARQVDSPMPRPGPGAARAQVLEDQAERAVAVRPPAEELKARSGAEQGFAKPGFKAGGGEKTAAGSRSAGVPMDEKSIMERVDRMVAEGRRRWEESGLPAGEWNRMSLAEQEEVLRKVRLSRKKGGG